MDKLEADKVESYWNRKALELQTDPLATMKDVYLRQLEIQTICDALQPSDILVDIGAGNAYSAIQYAKKCRYVYALDYAEEMIRQARVSIQQSGLSNIEAQECNIFDLQKNLPNDITAINCTRTLINLSSGVDISEALTQLIRSTPNHGKLILTEGFSTGFEGLNKQRSLLQLSPIPLNWHNILLDKSKIDCELNHSFSHMKVLNYGFYYLLSRVFYPAMIYPQEPNFTSDINKTASQMFNRILPEISDSLENISILLTYVCLKRK